MRLLILFTLFAGGLLGLMEPPAAYLAQEHTMLNPRDGLRYVWIHPGRFQMGCSAGDKNCGPQEKPDHQVTLSQGFWIGQTLVTQTAYSRVVGSNPSYIHRDRGPVESVTWDEAQNYCRDVGMHLPTDAQWEYAARGGSPEPLFAPLMSIAWYSANSSGESHNVGLKKANPYGLFDIIGDTWEWVADWYDEQYYPHSPAEDPSGPASGVAKVLRGGSWYNFPKDLRVSNRDWLTPSLRQETVSFRCVQEATAP